jgi:hypothetical protein
MNISMTRPNLNGISSMCLFNLDYSANLEKLIIGEHIIVGRFPDKSELRFFARIMLNSDPLRKDEGKNYEYTLNEKDLTYKVKRII